jgi:uncharacterized protein (TIGR02246 family)
MSRTHSPIAAWLGVVVVLAGLGATRSALAAAPAATRAADEAAIRGKDDTFEQAIAAKNVEQILALYADNAVLFAPKAPAAIGKHAIRDAFQGLMMAPGVKMTFKTTHIIVSRSGDLAMQRATFQLETTGKDGKASTETGQAVMVWRKQSDGTWKVIADTNADDK